MGFAGKAGHHKGGPAPIPKTKAPHSAAITGNAAPMNNLARVQNTGKGPQLGVTNAPTGPHPAGLQKSAQPLTPNLAPTASKKPKNRTHPFFGSNNLGY